MDSLYFLDKYDEYREIATDVKSLSECFKLISKFLKEHNYKSYYTRTWEVDNRERHGIMFDVGSHSEFFFWGEIYE